MKILRIHQQGEPDVMKLEDAPVPEPGAGTVRVKIEAIGVNFVDIYQRSGQFKMNVPFTTGQEAAGAVDALGEGVTGFAVGQRVAYASVLGAYAEYTIVPAERLVPIPDGVDVRQAAAVMLQGMTAHYLSTSTFPIEPGQIVLIHAAAGGTGALLVQMAKLRSAHVIGTVSTDKKAALAREAGADDVLFYDGFEAEVKRLTGGRGVDVVYDSVGKDTFEHSLNCLRPRGCLVLFGASSGAVPPFDPLTLMNKGSLFLTRPTLGHYLLTREEVLARAGAVFGWIAAGKLTVRIDRALPLSDAPEAHRALASRATMGKVLLIP
jgi:NADPH:quinone reductase